MVKGVYADDLEVGGGGEVVNEACNVVLHQVKDVGNALGRAQLVYVRLYVRHEVEHRVHDLTRAVYALRAGAERRGKLLKRERLAVHVALDLRNERIKVVQRVLQRRHGVYEVAVDIRLLEDIIEADNAFMKLLVYVVVQIVEDFALVVCYTALAVQCVPVDDRASCAGRVAACRLIESLHGVAQLFGAVSYRVGRVDDVLLAGRKAILHVGDALAAVVEHVDNVREQSAGHSGDVQRRLCDRGHRLHYGDIGAQIGLYVFKLIIKAIQGQRGITSHAGEQ